MRGCEHRICVVSVQVCCLYLLSQLQKPALDCVCQLQMELRSCTSWCAAAEASAKNGIFFKLGFWENMPHLDAAVLCNRFILVPFCRRLVRRHAGCYDQTAAD